VRSGQLAAQSHWGGGGCGVCTWPHGAVGGGGPGSSAMLAGCGGPGKMRVCEMKCNTILMDQKFISIKSELLIDNRMIKNKKTAKLRKELY
jgi:hypothetical protein